MVLKVGNVVRVVVLRVLIRTIPTVMARNSLSRTYFGKAISTLANQGPV
jgi:hypothetical protein